MHAARHPAPHTWRRVLTAAMYAFARLHTTAAIYHHVSSKTPTKDNKREPSKTNRTPVAQSDVPATRPSFLFFCPYIQPRHKTPISPDAERRRAELPKRRQERAD